MPPVYEKREGYSILEWYSFNNIQVNGSLLDEYPAIHHDLVVEDVKLFQNISEEDMQTRGMDIYCNTAIKLFFSVFSGCLFDDKSVITDSIVIDSTTDDCGNTVYSVCTEMD